MGPASNDHNDRKDFDKSGRLAESTTHLLHPHLLEAVSIPPPQPPPPRPAPMSEPEVDEYESKETDEEGSKIGEGDYEDVRNFDEESDLKMNKPVPSNPDPASLPSTATISPTAATTTKSSVIILDPVVALDRLSSITQIPWMATAGKRPPRDMKRLDPSIWYVVCKATRWGECTALFLRSSLNETDSGFFKPPTRYVTYAYEVGDCIRVSRVGYSPSRNKIALDIVIRPSALGGGEIPPEKLNWMPPEMQSSPNMGHGTALRRKKKKDDGDGSSRKRQAAGSNSSDVSGIMSSQWNPMLVPQRVPSFGNNMMFSFPSNLVMHDFHSFYNGSSSNQFGISPTQSSIGFGLNSSSGVPNSSQVTAPRQPTLQAQRLSSASDLLLHPPGSPMINTLLHRDSSGLTNNFPGMFAQQQPAQPLPRVESYGLMSAMNWGNEPAWGAPDKAE